MATKFQHYYYNNPPKEQNILLKNKTSAQIKRPLVERGPKVQSHPTQRGEHWTVTYWQLCSWNIIDLFYSPHAILATSQ